MPAAPSPNFRIKIRVKYKNTPEMFLSIVEAITKTGGSIESTNVVSIELNDIIRDIIIDNSSYENAHSAAESVKSLSGIEVIDVCDSIFEMHTGGKIEIKCKSPLISRDDLSMAYTPGVARVSKALAENPSLGHTYTIRRNMIAVVSDGSAVLGLGNIGPLGAMPVMEGKAMLFKEFGGVDAFPICLDTQDSDEIVSIVKALSPVFGGINLEDISAPRCFDIEERLIKELDIPVFHDDQHGTAAVVLAALINASKIVGKKIEEMTAVVSGAGAAGVACTKALMAMGIADIIVCDTKGSIYDGRKEGMNSAKEYLAKKTNKNVKVGSLKDCLTGADLLLGVSGPGLLNGEDLKVMAEDAIVFALSNPIPEVMPEEAMPYIKVMATGRSDYPNQINNVLCFPGLFRGLLDSGAVKVTGEMVVAAGKAIAAQVAPNELSVDYIIPSVFNKKVAPAVAEAVSNTAIDSGLIREYVQKEF